MKKLILPKGKFALIDDEDFDYLNQFKWVTRTVYNNLKVIRFEINSEKNALKMVFLHREIMKVFDSKIQIVHLNGDYLDNQKKNLRILTRTESAQFKKKLLRKKIFEGVYYLHSYNKYLASIKKDNIEYRLGYYKTEIEAAKAYDKGALLLFGRDAHTNKKKGLIDYSHLDNINITLSYLEKRTARISKEDQLLFTELSDKIIELRAKYKIKELSSLININPASLSKIANRRRPFSIEKIKQILKTLKKKKL